MCWSPTFQGFPYRGDGEIPPPLLVVSPQKKIIKSCPPPVPTPNPLPNSFVFMQFLAIFSSLSPKSGGKPCARNWYTHWSGDLPQLQGSIFWFFFFFVFYSLFQGQKIHKSVFWPQKWPKKDLKTKKSKIWPLQLWRVTRPMCVPTFSPREWFGVEFYFWFLEKNLTFRFL